MRNINITQENHEKLNKILQDLNMLHEKLEEAGIIQKHEYDQAYKGKGLQLIVGILKMFRDYIKYQFGNKKETPLSRWYNWQKDNTSKARPSWPDLLHKDNDIKKIITGSDSISAQINELGNNRLGHDYREVFYGCLKTVDNIPSEIIQQIGRSEQENGSSATDMEISTSDVMYLIHKLQMA